MRFQVTFTFLGLIAASLAQDDEVNYPDPSIACGSNSDSGSDVRTTNPLDTSLCPSDDLYCRPEDPSCADLTRCPGLCAYINTYARCGGFTNTPRFCKADEICTDDPRNPESCGMACDAPGICLTETWDSCGSWRLCNAGRWCYPITGTSAGVCL